MDYNMNEIDVPRFKRGNGKKTGRGFMDWVKKHKKELGLTAGAVAALGALAASVALSHKVGEDYRGYRQGFPARPFNPLTEAEVLALPKKERQIQEDLARKRVEGTTRANLPMYPPAGGPTQKQMDDLFLESRSSEEQKERRSSIALPSELAQINRTYGTQQPKRHLGFFVVPPEIRAQAPQAIPLSQAHSEFLKNKKGRGNPLAKKVMAYKKKHGCSLKEAWAQFK